VRNVDLAALKDKLVGVPGIGALTQTNIGGRMTFGFNGLVVGVDPSKTDDEIATAILEAADAQQASKAPPFAAPPMTIATPMPQPAAAAAAPQPKATTMSNPAPGSFAAGIKAILENAQATVARAQADGFAKVNAAAGKLADAAVHTTVVAENMAQNISDQADAVLAELGQISNLPPSGS